MPTTLSLTYYFFIYFSFKSPVLAAAPDIQHPFFRISPVKPPILPKNHPQLGEILQNTPLCPLKSSKTLLFIPQTPENPIFPLKTLPNPYFFRFFILFHQKSRILSTFHTGRFDSLLFPIFSDFQEIIKFPALSYFSPIS